MRESGKLYVIISVLIRKWYNNLNFLDKEIFMETDKEIMEEMEREAAP